MLEIFPPVFQTDLGTKDANVLDTFARDSWAESGLKALKNRKGLYEHSIRVAFIASELFRKDGMSKEEILAASQAGLLHDIGKLSIPEEVFEKAKLTETDMKLIETHVRIGFLVVSPHFPLAARMIAGHHEFQKNAYPRKAGRNTDDPHLKRMQQLLALADSTDAAMSERSYKPAIPAAEARVGLVKLFKDEVLVDFAISKRNSIIVD